MRALVMTGAPVGGSVGQLFGDIPSALVPLNGRPVLLPIIQELLESGATDITIVIGHQSQQVKDVCQRFVSPTVSIRFVEVDPKISAGAALLYSLSYFHPGDDVLINLGDTYVPGLKAILHPGPFVLVADGIDDKSQWCTVQVEASGAISAFFNKSEVDRSELVVAGVYRITSLPAHISLPLQLRRPEISDVLEACSTTGNAYQAVKVTLWFDVGHIDRYQVAKKRLLEARSFNSLTFDDFLGTVTKHSEHWEKLEAEAAWALALPQELQALSPRIIQFNRAAENTSITMEYYGYPTAAELWLYSSFSSGALSSMARRLIEVLERFRAYPREVTSSDFNDMYRVKTEKRIVDAMSGSTVLDTLFKLETITLNGRTLPGWPQLWAVLNPKIDELYAPQDCSLIHGDFCLSNILYDIGGGIVRVIDARGKWGNADGGDIKYDVAKLRHSLCGMYDFIVNDLFDCEFDGQQQLDFRLIYDRRHKEVGMVFDKMIAERFDLEKIKLIEGLLFISMLPLHSNKPQRQLAMFATGMDRLSSVAGLA
jgi:dTDP-glucose pyrophosphorylase